MNNEIKRSSGLFVLGVLRYLFKVALHLFLANNMLPVLYGDYNIAMKFLKTFMDLSLFGTSSSTPVFLARYLENKKHNMAILYVAWNVKLLVHVYSIIFFLALLSMLAVFATHYTGLIDIREYHLAFLMLWIAPIAAIASLLKSYALTNKQIYIAALFPDMMSAIVQILLFVLAVYYLQFALSNLLMVAIILFSYIVVALVALLFINRQVLLLLFEGLKQRKRIQRVTGNRWFSTSSKLIVSDLTFSLISMADLLVVKLVVANPSSVGHYAAILLITSSIWLIPKRIYISLRPYYSTLMITQKGRLELRAMFDKPVTFVSLIVIVACLGIILLSKPLLALFGPSYIAARPTMIVMTLFVGLSAIVRTDKAILLSYSGYERYVLWLNAIELLLVVLCTIPATFYYGIMGTAIATGLVIVTFKPLAADYFIHKKLAIPSRFYGFLWRFL